MKTVPVQVSEEMFAAIESASRAEMRTVENWLDMKLRVYFYGAAASLPPATPEQLGRFRRVAITKHQRARVFRASKGVCVYCKTTLDPFAGWAVDHVLPVAKGGTNDPSNLVASCESCNTKKSATPVADFLAKQGRE